MQTIVSGTYASHFVRYREEFEEELDSYYDSYPVNIAPIVSHLDQAASTAPGSLSYTEKSMIYPTAAQLCEVHVFKYMPFYFELISGRSRFSWGGDGVGAWYKNHHFPALMPMVEEIQNRFEGFFSFNGLTAAVLDFDHHSLDYDTLLRLGLTGIRSTIADALERTSDKREKALYQAMTVGVDSLAAISKKFADQASDMLANSDHTTEDPVILRNLKRIADDARKYPEGPPKTFFQALNAIIFMRELIGSLEGVQISTFGHMDRLLIPYYENDIAEGRITRDEAAELLSAFLLYTEVKFACRRERHETSTTVVLGGCDADGNPVCNEITRMVLKLYGDLNLMEPKLHVRLTQRHPRELKSLCARLTARKLNVLAIYSDDVVIQAGTRAGRALRDARLYIGGGCQENKLQNCEINSRATLYMNVPKIFDTIFDQSSAEKLSVSHDKLNTISDCSTFDSLYAALMRNANTVAGELVKDRNEGERTGAQINPCPILSAFTDDCIRKGLDITEGGARYSVASIGLTGMATFIDSLLAIRHVVFQEQRMSLAEFADVLSKDFRDHEQLKLYIRTQLPKYGSDNAEARELSKRVFHDMAKAVSGFPNGRGGTFEPSLFSHTNYMRLGEKTGATPDGRTSGTYVSKGIGPSYIALGDQWQTGQILDALGAIDLTDYPVIGVSDLMLPVISMKDADRIIIPIIDRFLENGGSVLQMNSVDVEELKEARKHPEDYPNMIVRVSGFSANFVTLSEAVQEEIINRARCV